MRPSLDRTTRDEAPSGWAVPSAMASCLAASSSFSIRSRRKTGLVSLGQSLCVKT
jgi:hypothetical protein